MQNPIQKFRQNSIVFEKPGILSENLKTVASSNYPTVEFNIFCWNFAHVSYLTMSTKVCLDFPENTLVSRKRVQTFSKKYWTAG